MGLFYNNNVAGSGVSKNPRGKKPMFRFFEMFTNKFWTFFKINIIYFIFCIPIVTFGPATAAMTALMRNIYLERPQFIFHDFVEAFKKNFKQSFLIGIIDVIFIGLAVFSFFFYTVSMANDSTNTYWLFYALSMAAEVIFLLMNFFIYPQIVALNLGMKDILKNAAILAFVNLKGNLVSLFMYIVYAMCILFFGLYTLILLPFIPLAWLSFLSVFTSYPAIQKYIINPFYEQQGLKNPELPDYDDEEAVFEDMGGKEAPINLKKADKKGKVIK